jgi:Rad3-related DNA helicase
MNILNHFPKKEFYPNQREALVEIDEAFDRNVKFVILEMGTGGGKSVIMYTTSKMFGSAHICVMQKLLQKQYTKTLDLPSADGRGNSLCMVYLSGKDHKEVHCDAGKCVSDKEFKCSFRPTPPKDNDDNSVVNDGDESITIAKKYVDKNYACTSAKRGELYWASEMHCQYWDQKVKALTSPIVVHNYPYLISEANYVGDFGSKTLLGCDEAHNLTKIFIEFVKITISIDDIINVFKGGGFINHGKDISGWIPGLIGLRDALKIRLDEESKYLKELKSFDVIPVNLKEILEREDALVFSLNKLNDKLTEFFTDYEVRPNNWTISIHSAMGDTIDRIELKPIFIGNYTEKLLFRLGNKVLLMSATILDPVMFCEELGIPLDQVQYINVPSSFDPERSPIYPLNVGKINSKNFEEKLPESIKALEEVLDIHAHQKGIVHCASGKIRNFILNNIGIQYRSRLLVPMASNKKLVMEKHAASECSVILGISDEEGLSLDDDLSRFNYFPTLPFNSLGDPRTAKIAEQDKILESEAKERGEPFVSRYETDMMRRLLQGAGRSSRNEHDFSFTYIAPSALGYYINKFSKYYEFRGFYPSSFAFFKARIKYGKDGFGRTII